MFQWLVLSYNLWLLIESILFWPLKLTQTLVMSKIFKQKPCFFASPLHKINLDFFSVGYSICLFFFFHVLFKLVFCCFFFILIYVYFPCWLRASKCEDKYFFFFIRPIIVLFHFVHCLILKHYRQAHFSIFSFCLIL